jgi:hypothetical protein
MDLRPLIPLGVLVAFAVLIYGVDRLFRWMQRRGWIAAPTEKSGKRAVGHAALGLQQFIDPGAQYIVQTQNVEQREDDDLPGDGVDEVTLQADLAECLGKSPVDIDEVRRSLSVAARAGLDWRLLFSEAVREELSRRPYRAPSMPPASRVAPRNESL